MGIILIQTSQGHYEDGVIICQALRILTGTWSVLCKYMRGETENHNVLKSSLNVNFYSSIHYIFQSKKQHCEAVRLPFKGWGGSFGGLVKVTQEESEPGAEPKPSTHAWALSTTSSAPNAMSQKTWGQWCNNDTEKLGRASSALTCH